jgi:hypothetical protein
LWCRSVIIAAGSKFKDDGRAAHDHVIDCQKAPAIEQLLTTTPLFPVGNDPSQDFSDFLDALKKVQKLENLAVQVQQGLCSCISEMHISPFMYFRLVI